MTTAAKISKMRKPSGGSKSRLPPGGKKGPNRKLFTESDWATVKTQLAAGVPHDRIAYMLNVSTERFRDTFWDLLKDAKQVGGKKPLLFTEEKREFVRLAAAMGRTPAQVAEYFGLAEETVRMHFSHEWRTAATDMVVRVGTALYRKAMSDTPGAVDAGKFIMSRRGGAAWADKPMELNVGIKVGADVDLSTMDDAKLEALRELAEQAVLAAKADESEAQAVPRITVDEPKPESADVEGEVGVVHGRGSPQDESLGGEPDAPAGSV